MDRRGFLGMLASVPFIGTQKAHTATLAPRPSLSSAAALRTLTWRIRLSLTRRQQLGQHNGAICVSDAGFARICEEHGLDPHGLRDLRLVGVPVYRRPELSGDDYWVLATDTWGYTLPPWRT